MQAIETRYKGFRFRSRLEARWAVFFDCLGIQWVYEPEGYELIREAGMLRYLPDFWLPEVGLFAEVKGNLNSVSFGDDVEKMLLLANQSRRGILLLAELQPIAVLIAPHKNPHSFDFVPESLGASVWSTCPLCRQWALKNGPGYTGEYDAYWCLNCCKARRVHVRTKRALYNDKSQVAVRLALDAARAARFEHGEKPEITRTSFSSPMPTLEPISIIKPKQKS